MREEINTWEVIDWEAGVIKTVCVVNKYIEDIDFENIRGWWED